jgi:predicted short-subunit dehydrogenase-like oxidoreductase (DUF2520 family)
MSDETPASRVTIIGAGRMGQGLALALTRRGGDVSLLARRPREVVPPLRLVGSGQTAEALRGADLVLIATPDDAVSTVAGELADQDAVHARHVVLHLSGLLDRRVLLPLEATGAGLGSFHPLQTVADPASAPGQLAGAYAGIEGDERALRAAERLARALGMVPVRIPPAAKPAYHAAAALVANYTAALLGVAERVAASAGVAPELAARIYLPLLEGTARNLVALGPVAALTGPVRRGDVRTIGAHLDALAPADRELYRRLAAAALELARRAGLEPGAAERVARLLRPPP